MNTGILELDCSQIDELKEMIENIIQENSHLENYNGSDLQFKQNSQNSQKWNHEKNPNQVQNIQSNFRSQIVQEISAKLVSVSKFSLSILQCLRLSNYEIQQLKQHRISLEQSLKTQKVDFVDLFEQKQDLKIEIENLSSKLDQLALQNQDLSLKLRSEIQSKTLVVEQYQELNKMLQFQKQAHSLKKAQLLNEIAGFKIQLKNIKQEIQYQKDENSFLKLQWEKKMQQDEQLEKERQQIFKTDQKKLKRNNLYSDSKIEFYTLSESPKIQSQQHLFCQNQTQSSTLEKDILNSQQQNMSPTYETQEEENFHSFNRQNGDNIFLQLQSKFNISKSIANKQISQFNEDFEQQQGQVNLKVVEEACALFENQNEQSNKQNNRHTLNIKNYEETQKKKNRSIESILTQEKVLPLKYVRTKTERPVMKCSVKAIQCNLTSSVMKISRHSKVKNPSKITLKSQVRIQQVTEPKSANLKKNQSLQHIPMPKSKQRNTKPRILKNTLQKCSSDTILSRMTKYVQQKCVKNRIKTNKVSIFYH